MKRRIKGMLYRAIPWIGCFYMGKAKLPIIYYHDIVEGEGFGLQRTNIKVFQSHMEYLHRNDYKPLLLSELEEVLINQDKPKEKFVVITFDDGYRSNYLMVLPIMRRWNLKFNIFINTRMIEEEKPNYLTIAMVKEMYDSKLVEFGSHTHSHVDAKSITGPELLKEIKLCNAKIFDWLGYHTKDFCYPYGYYSKRTNQMLSKYYRRLYTSDCKPLEKMNEAIIRGRIGISTQDTIVDFSNKLKGRYDIMYWYYRRKNPN